VEGDGATVGSVRELNLITGFPGKSSRERLEILDDEQRVISFRILGGEHCFFNYRSVTSVHEVMSPDGPLTMVVESYVMDVMPGNTAEETRYVANTIIGFNHRNLAEWT
jgi:abscisic acid receptor PYR/PYL family